MPSELIMASFYQATTSNVPLFTAQVTPAPDSQLMAEFELLSPSDKLEAANDILASAGWVTSPTDPNTFGAQFATLREVLRYGLNLAMRLPLGPTRLLLAYGVEGEEDPLFVTGIDDIDNPRSLQISHAESGGNRFGDEMVEKFKDFTDNLITMGLSADWDDQEHCVKITLPSSAAREELSVLIDELFNAYPS